MPYETDHYTWISAATDIGIVVAVFALAWLLSQLPAKALYRLTPQSGNNFNRPVVRRGARAHPW